MTNAPSEHVVESQKLTADALVDLFEIILKDQPVVIRLKNNDTVVWQGNQYEGWPIQLTGEKRTAEEELPRPRFQFMNPEGLFSKFAIRGDLNYATVRRKRVLLQHIENDTNIYQQAQWYVARVPEIISGQAVTLELRSFHDGPAYKIPGRVYLPPEFPAVNLA